MINEKSKYYLIYLEILVLRKVYLDLERVEGNEYLCMI